MSNSTHQAAPPRDGLLTTRDAAAFLKFSPRTLEGLRVIGGGPVYFKLSPRAVRYARADLDAWLAECRRENTSDPGPEPW